MAGFLSALGLPSNPFLDWVGQNRNTIAGIGAGIGSSPDIGKALSNAAANSLQGRQMDDAYATSQKEKADREAQINKTVEYLKQAYPDLAEAVQGGVPVADAFAEAWRRQYPKQSGDSADPFTLSPGQQRFAPDGTLIAQVADDATGAGAAKFETGFGPIPGRIGDKYVVALPGNDGRLYVNGQVAPETFVPTTPYDLNAEKGAGAAFGKSTGGAQFSVPNAQLELDQSNAALSNLKTDPNVLAGMNDWFNQWGALPRGAWVQGGSNMAQFQNAANNVIDRSWLSARAALKGGGQITDYEGAKAENAVSMMKSALDKGDKGQFERARDDYEYWIQQGFSKLQQTAGTMDGYGASTSGAAPAGGVDDILGKYGL